jgi:hypothetical protein
VALVVVGHTHQQGAAAARWRWVADGVPELRRTDEDAAAGAPILKSGWPDERSVARRLSSRSREIVVTHSFEGL